MDSDGLKRKHTFRQAPSKKAKKDDGGVLKSGFGARMLAKMGYKGEGGLGREGEGISEPIQVVMRGTKGGVGIVAEKSQQQRREERRKAEANGETYVDTSEEERQERKKKKAARAKEARSGATAPARSKKPQFELEEAGIHVPLALQSIIDATTGASTPTSSVSLRGTDVVPFENSLQARVRRDLSAFTEAFEELHVELQAIPLQEDALAKELAQLVRQMEEAEDIKARLQSLRTSSFAEVCAGIRDLRIAYPLKPLHRESIALIHPHFSKATATWSPLEEALEDVAAAFSELADLVQPRSRRMASQAYTHPSDALVAHTVVAEDDTVKRDTTSSYETMILKLWLPTVSSAITQWDVRDARPVVHLFDTWKAVLPPFVARRVLEQVTRKLITSVHEWNPRKFKKSPHTWIVEWLPYLQPADLDPKGSGLLAEVRRKIRHALQSVELSRGPMAGMEQWRKVFGKHEFDRLLTTHLVPRFAAHLRDNFEVNPAEQDLAPLEAVFAWKGLIADQTIGELLKAQFFPKFLDIVHQWLSSDSVVFTEVEKWIEWWRDEILGPQLNALPSVSSSWDEAYTLINQALDLGDARLTELPAPRVEGRQETLETTQGPASGGQQPARPAAPVEEATFRDVVEEFCAEESLLMIPLREAHDVTGLPLFRVTASATGRGGAVAYLRGDVLWVQSKKDRSSWEPTGLDAGLVAKAEGK